MLGTWAITSVLCLQLFAESVGCDPFAPVGAARIGAGGKLELRGGAFRADRACSDSFCLGCRETGMLMVEMILIPERRQTGNEQTVMGVMGRDQTPNLRISQRGNQLWLEMVTRCHAGPPVREKLGEVEPAAATHLLLFYVAAAPNDKLFCYLNGEQTLGRDYDGGFSNWPDQAIVLGNDLEGTSPWRGQICGVTLGHRSLSAEGAGRRYKRHAANCRLNQH
jgi:hypothetical protein